MALQLYWFTPLFIYNVLISSQCGSFNVIETISNRNFDKIGIGGVIKRKNLRLEYAAKKDDIPEKGAKLQLEKMTLVTTT